jgi:molybdopterin converting factor small subunit
MEQIDLDVWLYGDLARFAREFSQGSFANLRLSLPVGTTIGDLLAKLRMSTEERGFTFINGNLSAMPGIQTDLKHQLKTGDRIAFFHLQSMWPFQYRHGVAVTKEINEALQKSSNQALHHTYKK